MTDGEKTVRLSKREIETLEAGRIVKGRADDGTIVRIRP